MEPCKHPVEEIDWEPFPKDYRYTVFTCGKCKTIIGFANKTELPDKDRQPRQ